MKYEYKTGPAVSGSWMEVTLHKEAKDVESALADRDRTITGLKEDNAGLTRKVERLEKEVQFRQRLVWCWKTVSLMAMIWAFAGAFLRGHAW